MVASGTVVVYAGSSRNSGGGNDGSAVVNIITGAFRRCPNNLLECSNWLGLGVSFYA